MDIKVWARETWDAASDHFDEPANGFLINFGAQLVNFLSLRPGDRVLEFACGTGHSSLPAAEQVGPSGNVTAVDLSENLLALARRKARDLGLSHIDFRLGDMEKIDFGEQRFDAVMCGFGVFMVDDIEGLIARFWKWVRPGGKLAISSWAPGTWAPAEEGIWLPSLKAVRPEVDTSVLWNRIETVEGLRAAMQSGGIAEADIVECRSSWILRSPEDWWTMTVGLGTRWDVDQLSPAEVEQVRSANVGWIRDNSVKSVEINVLYAVATKPTTDTLGSRPG